MAAVALETTFPHPCASDGDDVRCALTVAESALKRGDPEDARKWLRRAAKAAANADDVMRALTLSKAAAALSSSQGSRRGADQRPTTRPPSRPSAVPKRRSGIAPRLHPTPPRRSSRPVRRASKPSPSSPQAAPTSSREVPRSAVAPPPLPTFAARELIPAPIPSAAATIPRRTMGSDLDATRPRLQAPAIPPPPPVEPPAPRAELATMPDPASCDFALPLLLDEDDESPTNIKPRSQVQPPPPRQSEPIALERQTPIPPNMVPERPVPERSGSFPSTPNIDLPPMDATRSHEGRSRGEMDTDRDLTALDPPVTPDGGIPLSAARVAVVLSANGRPPEVRFLPFGARAPEGAVTAMLVTTNARDAAKLAEMLVGAT
jgi:hypothetical protein